MDRPLDPYELWMVKSNLEHVKTEGAHAVVARLHYNGYHRVANAVETQAKRTQVKHTN